MDKKWQCQKCEKLLGIWSNGKLQLCYKKAQYMVDGFQPNSVYQYIYAFAAGSVVSVSVLSMCLAHSAKSSVSGTRAG